MRFDVPYEVIDGRPNPSTKISAPVGIINSVQGGLSIWLLNGRGFEFSLEGDDFEVDGEMITLHTEEGPIFLVVIRADSSIFKEWFDVDEDVDPEILFGICTMR